MPPIHCINLLLFIVILNLMFVSSTAPPQADALEVKIRRALVYSINSASIGPRTSVPSYMRWLTSPRFLPATATLRSSPVVFT